MPFDFISSGTDVVRQLGEADLLPLRPWVPTLKYRWVCIRPTRVSGREFRRGPEPERS